MVKFLYRHNKDYSRYNIVKSIAQNIKTKKDIYILLPFSKNQFLKYFFKRDRIINDFFISNYDTYVHDRQKITKYNPRAWWKYAQDWINFRFSYYLLSDTQKHFEYWEELFGKFKGKHLVLPVLADKAIYRPSTKNETGNKSVNILFYGSFIPLHGVDIILHAFKILENKNIDFTATIIGNGQTFKTQKALFESLSLKNVKMNGEIIDEKNLSDEIRKSDIILGIFGNSKKAKSVVPNKVFQALACKKTIVTMNSDAIDEFFTKDDLIQCTNTPKEVAKQLELIIKDSELRDKISTHGYNSFMKLYKKSQDEFEMFIAQMGEST